MNFRTKLLASGLSLAAIAVFALGALWFFVLDTDPPPPVSIDEAIASRDTPAPGLPAVPSAPIDGNGLRGEWIMAENDSTFAGYRIDQQVAGIGNETVVGRTSGVEASFTFDGSAITGLQVAVDMTTLRSDESLRDSVLRGEALQTGDFPTATFVVTEAISVDRVPEEGARISQAVTGEMTLHGVTRPIETQVEAVLQDGQLIVVGSSEIILSDFGITPPRGPASVLSVEDHGVMEVQLMFQKSDGAMPNDAPPTEDASPVEEPPIGPY